MIIGWKGCGGRGGLGAEVEMNAHKNHVAF